MDTITNTHYIEITGPESVGSDFVLGPYDEQSANNIASLVRNLRDAYNPPIADLEVKVYAFSKITDALSWIATMADEQ